MMCEATRKLLENAENLRKQLEENRRVVYNKEKQQEGEITRLKERLRELQVNNASTETTQELSFI